MTVGEISSALYVSTNTVKTHAQAVYRKLGVHSRTDAVAAARRRQLI
jgi:LuxR family maltose regulon positive regulatory protein